MAGLHIQSNIHLYSHNVHQVSCCSTRRNYNLKLTSGVFAIMETASVCCSCTLVAPSHCDGTRLDQCFFFPRSLMTLTGLTVGDVLLDTPGRRAGAQWLCIIDPFGVNECPTCAMSISVGPLGERPILAEDWHYGRASAH